MDFPNKPLCLKAKPVRETTEFYFGVIVRLQSDNAGILLGMKAIFYYPDIYLR